MPSAWLRSAWRRRDRSETRAGTPAAADREDEHRGQEYGDDERQHRAETDRVRDETARDGTGDADEDRHADPDRVASGHDETRERADDQTGDDVTEDQAEY